MRLRACPGSYRRRPHLLLEPLEDRTALSNPGATWPGNAIVGAPAYPAGSAAAQSPAAPTVSASSAPVSTSWPSGAVPSIVAAPDADDASYSASSISSTGTGSPAQSATSAQTPGTAGSSQSSTTTQSGTYSSGGKSANPASAQTSGNGATYYSQALGQTTANGSTPNYPTDYYSKEYYLAEAQRAAQLALRVAEYDAVRVFQQEASADPAPLADALPTEAMVEHAATPAPATDNRAVTVGARPTDEELIPAVHHVAAVSDWSAELLPANGPTIAAPPADDKPELLASAGESVPLVLPEPGQPAAGISALDLGALERGLDRFFAHLDEQGRRLLNWPGLATLGTWLAAGATATAAFELARRATRAPTARPAGFASWQDGRRARDIDLLFFFGLDES